MVDEDVLNETRTRVLGGPDFLKNIRGTRDYLREPRRLRQCLARLKQGSQGLRTELEHLNRSLKTTAEEAKAAVTGMETLVAGEGASAVQKLTDKVRSRNAELLSAVSALESLCSDSDTG